MKTSEMPVLELRGTPIERGRVYGETMRSVIAPLVESWRSHLGNFLHGTDESSCTEADQYLHEFFQRTQYKSAITKWAPDLLEEVKGLAEGANQSKENMLGMQLMDEEWVFGLRRSLDRPTTKCTAFGLPNQREGISYAGQNMDIGSWIEGGQVLLHILASNDGPESLVFTIAGEIGLNGLNSDGLGITCNTLPQLNYATDGLPVAFIVRKVLQHRDIDSAEQFLRSIKHASGQNYILSTAGDVRCFECCGTSVTRYQPNLGQGRVFHSNHPLASDDITNILPPEKMRSKNSVARFDSISSRLNNTSQLYSLEDIKAALSAHDDPENPVSRNINNENSPIGYTAGSSIYEFSNKPKLHLASGPPCETQYKVFEFKSHQ